MKIKTLLLGLLLASPPVAAWIIREPEPAPVAPVVESNLRIPLEVHAKGSEARLVYVEVQTQSVPEPSTIMLLVPAALLALRRRRTP